MSEHNNPREQERDYLTRLLRDNEASMRILYLEAELAEAKALLREVGPDWTLHRHGDTDGIWYRTPDDWLSRRDALLNPKSK